MKTPNRFIVVDDDPFNNLLCKYIILKFDKDAHITLFTDPKIALQELKETFTSQTNDAGIVLLLDINMPAMTGWEFLEAIEELEVKVPEHIAIYILSSSIDAGDIQKAAKSPLLKGFYPKPLSLETMYLIEQNLSSSY
jgi:CheY-like chemotaxis protein